MSDDQACKEKFCVLSGSKRNISSIKNRRNAHRLWARELRKQQATRIVAYATTIRKAAAVISNLSRQPAYCLLHCFAYKLGARFRALGAPAVGWPPLYLSHRVAGGPPTVKSSSSSGDGGSGGGDGDGECSRLIWAPIRRRCSHQVGGGRRRRWWSLGRIGDVRVFFFFRLSSCSLFTSSLSQHSRFVRRRRYRCRRAACAGEEANLICSGSCAPRPPPLPPSRVTRNAAAAA